MLIGIEKVSYLFARCQVYNTLYLGKDYGPTLASTAQLEITLIALYSESLSLLAHLVTLAKRTTAQRSFHALLNPVGLSERITKLEKLEWRIEADASNCERESKSSSDAAWTERFEIIQRLLNQQIVLSEAERTRYLDDCRTNERFEILQWISDIQYETDHYNARRGRTDGTGAWLLADQVYRDWRTTSASICLWLHGKRKWFSSINNNKFFCLTSRSSRRRENQAFHKGGRQLAWREGGAVK